MTYAYRMLPDGTGYVDAEGTDLRSPTQEDFTRIALITMHRTLLKEGIISLKFMILMPPQDLPSMVEFTQEMPIEEAKKRWPDTPVTGEEKDNERT